MSGSPTQPPRDTQLLLSIPCTSGASYNVSLWLAVATAGTPNDFTATLLLDGSPLLLIVSLLSVTAPSNPSYSLYSALVTTPVPGTLSLLLSARAADGGFFAVDDVAFAQAEPASSIRGDPWFVGFLGQRYQVHGVDGAVYSIISDPLLQINSRFAFLMYGACPRRYMQLHDGERQMGCWSHPGSYFASLALQTSQGDRLLINAGDAEEGLRRVLLNGVEVQAGETYVVPLRGGGGGEDGGADPEVGDAAEVLSVSRLSDGYGVEVVAGVYSMLIESSDRFLNIQRLDINDWEQLTGSHQPHGLLGQTWREPKLRPSAAQRAGAKLGLRDVVEGKVDDYAEQDDDLFGTRFMHNRFMLEAPGVLDEDEV